MKKQLKIALAQMNSTVGDIEGNAAKAAQLWKQAKGADIVVFPELAITGYPAEDLVQKPAFQKQAMKAVRALAAATAKGPAILIGSLLVEEGKIFNAVYFLSGGVILHTQTKHELPNYGVFDEKRHFSAGALPSLISFKGFTLGILVCEDMWHKAVPQALKGADILLSCHASPFEHDKPTRRLRAAQKSAERAGCPLVYTNMVAGQDDVVFDGGSFVMSAKGKVLGTAPQFEETLVLTAWEKTTKGLKCVSAPKAKTLDETAQHYAAMMLGLKDYITKNGFPGVVLGLSGGIDSVLSAAIAVDALGADKVKAVMLPSRYTSAESFADAAECARRFGISLEEIQIEGLVSAADEALAGTFAGKKKDVTEENIQSRLRGLLLMAYSNKFGHMVLTTGNKSELATGYATLYGDMCGGYNVLKDTYKTEVFALSKWRNKNAPTGALGPKGEVIPPNAILKAPTAELRENQKDEDSLPPYDVLDGILQALIEKELAIKEIVTLGYKRAVVEKVASMLYKAEYKRRQSAPGVKVTRKSFGRDRRYPITNRFTE